MQSKSCDGTIGECREKIIGNEKNKLKHAPISCENGTSPNFSSSMAPHEGTLYEKKTPSECHQASTIVHMLQYGSACGGLLTYFGSFKRQVGK